MADNFDVGRVTIAGGVGSLPANIGIGGESVLIKAMGTNAADVEVVPSGGGAGSGYPLSPGETVGAEYLNAREMTFVGTNGDVVAFLVTRA